MNLSFPTRLTKVSDRISVLMNDGTVYYFNNQEEFFRHNENDKIAFRFIVCQLFILRFAKQIELRKTFGISRSSMIGWIKEYHREGAKSFYKSRNNEKHYILKKKEIKRSQTILDKKISFDDIRFISSIDIDAIDNAIWEGRLIESEKTLTYRNRYRRQKTKIQGNIMGELKTMTKSRKKIYL